MVEDAVSLQTLFLATQTHVLRNVTKQGGFRTYLPSLSMSSSPHPRQSTSALTGDHSVLA